MGRKILFSFLGTNEYEPCFYSYQGQKASWSRFVQTAIYEVLRREVDHLEVTVFTTKEAKAKNWRTGPGKDGKPLEGLFESFARIAPEVNVKLVDISSRQDEDANWGLFEAIMNEIQTGDEIYFDVTHSFRTNPVIALIVLNYARLLKKATIGKMMYGWFEKLGSLAEVKKLREEERIAPIVDFTNMALLLDWTNGVDQFIRTGDASKIKELTTEEVKQFFTDDAQGEDTKGIVQLRKMADRLEETSLAFQTCRGRTYVEKINALRQTVEVAKQTKTKHLRPLVPLVDEIEEKYRDFDDDDVMNGYHAAKWCAAHGLIQQAYTFLRESIITIVCKMAGIDELNTVRRESVASALALIIRKVPEQEWQGDVGTIKHVFAVIEPSRELLKPYDKLMTYRNNLNHAAMNKDTFTGKSLKNKLASIIEELQPFFIAASEKLTKQKEII